MHQQNYSFEALLAASRGELFGPLGPQLPAPNMLMMDRIVSVQADAGWYKKGYLEAQLMIQPEVWFFACHFPGDPVMPGCLGLDAMWQLVGFFLGWSGFAGQVLPTSRHYDRACVTYAVGS